MYARVVHASINVRRIARDSYVARRRHARTLTDKKTFLEKTACFEDYRISYRSAAALPYAISSRIIFKSQKKNSYARRRVRRRFFFYRIFFISVSFFRKFRFFRTRTMCLSLSLGPDGMSAATETINIHNRGFKNEFIEMVTDRRTKKQHVGQRNEKNNGVNAHAAGRLESIIIINAFANNNNNNNKKLFARPSSGRACCC